MERTANLTRRQIAGSCSAYVILRRPQNVRRDCDGNYCDMFIFTIRKKKMFTLTEKHFHRVREKHQWGKCHGKPKSYPGLQKHQTKINEKALQKQWQRQYLGMRIGLLRQICKRQHWQINTTNRVFLIDNIRLWHFTNQPLLGEINAYETWLGNATWGGRCHASPTTADLSVCPQRNAVPCSFPVNNVPTANRLIRRRRLISSPGLAIKSSGRLGVWHAVGIHQRSHSHASEYNNYTAARKRTVEFLRLP